MSVVEMIILDHYFISYILYYSETFFRKFFLMDE